MKRKDKEHYSDIILLLIVAFVALNEISFRILVLMMMLIIIMQLNFIGRKLK